jgi:hypothetical protein
MRSFQNGARGFEIAAPKSRCVFWNTWSRVSGTIGVPVWPCYDAVNRRLGSSKMDENSSSRTKTPDNPFGRWIAGVLEAGWPDAAGTYTRRLEELAYAIGCAPNTLRAYMDDPKDPKKVALVVEALRRLRVPNVSLFLGLLRAGHVSICIGAVGDDFARSVALWSRKLAQLGLATTFNELTKSIEPRPGSEALVTSISEAAEEAKEDALREIDPYTETIVRFVLAATTIGRGPDFDGPADQFVAYDEILDEWLTSKESELATRLSTRFKFLHERVRALQDHAALNKGSAYALIGDSLRDCYEDSSEIGSTEFTLLTTKTTFLMRALWPILNGPEATGVEDRQARSVGRELASASVTEMAEGVRAHHGLARIWSSVVKKWRDVWASDAR